MLDRACEELGRDPSEVTRTVNVGFHMGKTDADAAGKRDQFDASYRERAAVQEGGMLFGTSAQVLDRVGAYADAGAEGLNIVMRAPFDLEALEDFVRVVIPASRGTPA